MKDLSPEEQQRALDRQLAALARADAGQQASPAVEAALRAQLRGRRARRRLSLRSLGLGAGAAVAAGLALWWARPPAPVTVEVRPAPVEPAPADEPRPLPAMRVAPGTFLPIGDPGRARQLEHGRIVRMEVPAGLVVSFGWPLPADDDRPRTADVLFGEDGVARAIRFLPAGLRTAR